MDWQLQAGMGRSLGLRLLCFLPGAFPAPGSPLWASCNHPPGYFVGVFLPRRLSPRSGPLHIICIDVVIVLCPQPGSSCLQRHGVLPWKEELRTQNGGPGMGWDGEVKTFLLSLGSLGIVHGVFGADPRRLIPVGTEGPDCKVC